MAQAHPIIRQKNKENGRTIRYKFRLAKTFYRIQLLFLRVAGENENKEYASRTELSWDLGLGTWQCYIIFQFSFRISCFLVLNAL